MSTEVHGPSCHHRARWQASDGGIQVVEVLQEGGARQPAGAPALVAWNTWRDSRAGELGPVVGRCPACDQPVVAAGDGLPPSEPWVLQANGGEITVSAASLVGFGGTPATDEQVDAEMQRRLRERFADQLFDVRLLFAGLLLIVVGLVATGWLAAVLFVLNFYLAMGSQGDFSGPFVP